MAEVIEPRGPLLSPGFWLHHAALAWRQALDSGLRPLGLTHTQFNLLASVHWLSNQSGPPTQQEAAEMSGADRMMASKVLRTLEDRGLITRVQDAQDSRAKRLAATPEGRDLVRQAVRVVAQVDADFFGAGDEREQLRQQLRNMAELRGGAG